MRLIKASTIYSDKSCLELVDFMPDQIPPYAILSHTWGSDEVVYADIRNNSAASKSSFDKIRFSCIRTIADGLDYLWIDSCCIDKSSSAELSEAINSMFDWYKGSEVCYAYMSGVSSDADTATADDQFGGCRWFTRGWTLQELLAPANVIFFSEDGVNIGEKSSLCRPLSLITGIDEDILNGTKSLQAASVAKRMSWAAYRNTTRPEDMAYCLMGLFDVNMPMLYGEGNKAFLRLQEEIMKQSDDHSIFAWVDPSAPADESYGLLATSPRQFAHANNIMSYQGWALRPPYSMTNRGLRIDLHISNDEKGFTVAALNCPAPDFEDSCFLGIYLKKGFLTDQQFARVRVGQFTKVRARGEQQTIFVRQKLNGISDADGVFLQHIIHIRRAPFKAKYSLLGFVQNPKEIGVNYQPLGNLFTMVQSFKKRPLAFRLSKGAESLSAGLIYSNTEEEAPKVLVMIGSAQQLKFGYQAKEIISEDPSFQRSHERGDEIGGVLSFDRLQRLFDPSPAGSEIVLKHHKVRVDLELRQVEGGRKHLMAHVHIESVSRPRPQDDGGAGAREELIKPQVTKGGKSKVTMAFKKLIS
ncbi:hypothetical protein CkaCkLH20_09623 [Colletotrichum karsti]|uniref:Vegetative incompatibility protein HET-E-1 n=1 Tax=Colletotrichum karsti TaxID=1095194 RepID=A0A9P6LHM7_9PEZI|nr:uncharacterized protein CkaCkLH20_09623 [Colletotrichum karsti]KAF9872760.1 hypothetical protein CkaCkLH20_09623 [Colletotrichum karsti]